ncbi:PIN domain-like protein [Melampsora americana]|nr:PIN domain-like protein [Melampsora americana]
MGFFYRTIRMAENGIKPAYVFDGKPPQLKSGVLAKRFEKRTEAQEEGEEAKEVGTTEDLDKLTRRTVKVTPEAQCAELCKGGLVYGAGSEDMDTLTFGTPLLLRHLTFSEARKVPINTVDLSKVLAGLDLTMERFIEFCILCGCDYVDPLKGSGSQDRVKIDQGTLAHLEAVVDHLRETGKNPPPEDWPWAEAKELFVKPDVTKSDDIKLEWNMPDVDGLVEFLVKEKGFDEERVRKGTNKLKLAMTKKQQGRLDGFFKAVPKQPGGNIQKAKNKKKVTKEKKAKTSSQK